MRSGSTTRRDRMVSDTVQDAAQVAHDVGLAAWLGGAMFGKFAHNPSLRAIRSPVERGQVANAAWNAYNPVNAAGLGSAATGVLLVADNALFRRGAFSRPAARRTLTRSSDGGGLESLLVGAAAGVLAGAGNEARRRVG